ncbi:MAG: hypothetical protein ACKOBV_06150, partial [Candidatus Kapaibacterium sp.]
MESITSSGRCDPAADGGEHGVPFMMMRRAMTVVAVLLSFMVGTVSSHAQLPTPTLLGYWHNWEGGAPY